MTISFIQIFGITFQVLFLSLVLLFFAKMKSQSTSLLKEGIIWTSRLSYSLYLGNILVIVAIHNIFTIIGIYDFIYIRAYFLYPIYFIEFYCLAIKAYYAIDLFYINHFRFNIL